MFLLISSANTKTNLIIDQKWGEELLNNKFLYQYIPEVSIKKVKNPNSQLPSIRVQYKNNFDLNFSGNLGTIQYKIENKKHLCDVITLIEYCLEYLRQKNGVYCFHGSAVSSSDKGILFFGPVSGLGKTTLALNLCLKHQFSFIGDEKILLNTQMKLPGGSKSIQYNKEFLNQSLHLNLDNKSKQELSKIINIEDKPVKINLIILPIIVRGSKSLEIEKWSQAKASFHLYEEMTRKIRGVSRRIINYSTPVKSLDNSSIWQDRSDFSQQLSQKVPCYLLKGGLLEVEDKIIEIVEN